METIVLSQDMYGLESFHGLPTIEYASSHLNAKSLICFSKVMFHMFCGSAGLCTCSGFLCFGVVSLIEFDGLFVVLKIVLYEGFIVVVQCFNCGDLFQGMDILKVWLLLLYLVD